MASIVISADALLEFLSALSLSNRGNDIYIYSGHNEELGDEPGQVTTLKGLATNEDQTFFGSYVVEADANAVDEFYLTAESISLIENLVYLINANCADDEEDVAEDEDDEDFYVAVKLNFADDEETGDTKITISPATGDKDTDRKFGGFLTQSSEDNLIEEFPAHQIARVIRGVGLDDAPNFVDREDADGNPIPVPNGPVTVWDYSTKSPLHLALAKSRSMKLPLAVQTYHASRIHSIRIGDNWFGAIAPVPLNKADMSEDGIYADSESLNAEYDFTGLREEDSVPLLEPTQLPDEEDYEDEEEYDDADAEVEEYDEEVEPGSGEEELDVDDLDEEDEDEDDESDADDADLDEEEETLGFEDEDEQDAEESADNEDEDALSEEAEAARAVYDASALDGYDEEIQRMVAEEMSEG